MFSVTRDVRYIGVDDHDIDLFESQYIVPNGISYNSYVILDEKVAVMDTVDQRKCAEFLSNLEEALEGRTPDYLVVHHMEPDHATSIGAFCEKYPDAKIVTTAKAAAMLPYFFETDLSGRVMTVKEGDTLSLGAHELTFLMAPMVHWPECMVSYDKLDKILFSADAFGKFGALDAEEDWACEARRYYFNIVGKYGAPVQALLKKAAKLDIAIICPLHGPVLSENLDYYLNLYNTWSSYAVEAEGVFIAHASIHGHTKAAAEKLAEILRAKGAVKVSVADLCRADMAECVEDAFKYGKIVLAASTYDGGVMFPMADFLHHLGHKAYQNRKVALMENGCWAPAAAKTMRAALESMKDVTVCDTVVSMRGRYTEADVAKMEALADELLG
ncbi:MAG: FprA family A-type flavoprotein [Butyricicoccus sp.]